MKIENNILKAYLRNVYFITGTAYAGKSTMVSLLAKRYGLLECGENYHMKVSDAVATPEIQPNLCYMKTMKDWQEFINRTPEGYDRWIVAVGREAAEFEIAELLHCSGDRLVIVDTNIPLELLHEISDEDHVAVMVSPQAVSVECFFDRQDPEKQFLKQQIANAKDPVKTMANYKDCLAKVNSQEHFDEYVNSGFFTILRTNPNVDTKEEVLKMLADHFGFTVPLDEINCPEITIDSISRYILPEYELNEAKIHLLQTGINNTIFLVSTGTADYYLRVSPAGFRSVDEVEAEMQLLQQLKLSHVNAAMPVAMRSGKYIWTLRTPKGISYAVLFEDAGGKVIGIKTQQEAIAFGTLIAQVHEVTDKFSYHTRILDTDYFIEEPLRALSYYRNDMSSYEEWEKFAGTLRSCFARYKLESRGILHADPHNYNVRFQDGLPKLFDFDSFGYGPQMYDLGEVLWNIKMLELPIDQEQQQMEWILEGYRQVRTLTPSMEESILFFALLREYRLTGVILRNAIRNGTNTFDESELESHRAWMNKLLEEWQQMHPDND